MSKEVKNIQCRNVVYIPTNDDNEHDYHLVKYTKYYTDGSSDRLVFLKEDFNKTFWVANIQNRNHLQKKERFPLDKLDEVKSTRKNILESIKNALGIKFGNFRPDELLTNRFVFGTSLSSTAELKYKFNQSKLAIDCKEVADVAVFDVETNVIDKDQYEYITMATLSFKDKVATVIHKDFFKGKYNGSDDSILSKLYEYDNIYLKSVNEERNIKQEFILVDTEWDVLETIFNKAHEWKPDFIVAWNMDYDITRTMRAAKRANKRMEDLLSDPIVPKQYRFFKYYPGRENFITDSGVFKNLANFEKWPFVYSPSSFVFIDAMCFYYASRKHKGKLPSYSLDSILKLEFPNDERIRKMKFIEADHIPSGSIDWHVFMQSKYPFEYCIYNKFDCIGIEYLDESTSDIKDALVASCYYSDYDAYESEPRRLADQLHWFNLSRGYAYGTGGKNNKVEELDSKLISRKDWIVNLRADLLLRNGLQVFEDAPDLPSSLFIHGADVDVTSSYPNGNATMNTSNETMTKELIDIEGIPEQYRREAGINYSAGFINCLENGRKLFNLPTLDNILTHYRKTVKGL